MPDINSVFLHSFCFPKTGYFILTFTFCKSIKYAWYEISVYAVMLQLHLFLYFNIWLNAYLINI